MTPSRPHGRSPYLRIQHQRGGCIADHGSSTTGCRQLGGARRTFPTTRHSNRLRHPHREHPMQYAGFSGDILAGRVRQYVETWTPHHRREVARRRDHRRAARRPRPWPPGADPDGEGAGEPGLVGISWPTSRGRCCLTRCAIRGRCWPPTRRSTTLDDSKATGRLPDHRPIRRRAAAPVVALGHRHDRRFPGVGRAFRGARLARRRPRW